MWSALCTWKVLVITVCIQPEPTFQNGAALKKSHREKGKKTYRILHITIQYCVSVHFCTCWQKESSLNSLTAMHKLFHAICLDRWNIHLLIDSIDTKVFSFHFTTFYYPALPTNFRLAIHFSLYFASVCFDSIHSVFIFSLWTMLNVNSLRF